MYIKKFKKKQQGQASSTWSCNDTKIKTCLLQSSFCMLKIKKTRNDANK